MSKAWPCSEIANKRKAYVTQWTQILTEEDFSALAYRSEGNHHILLEDRKKKLLYRLEKHPKSQLCRNREESARNRTELMRSVEFTKHVMAPLLGRYFLTPAELVELPENYIEHASKLFPTKAPGLIHKKDFQLDPLIAHALKLPDLCMPWTDHVHNDTICVEIKPSIVFIPTLETKPICDGNTGKTQRRACHHCIANTVKTFSQTERQPGWETTGYCPIDLFSGDYHRMKWALHKLLEVPLTKLKVFRNGNCIFSNDRRHDLAVHLRTFFKVNDGVNDNSCVEAFVSLVQKALTYVPENSGVHSNFKPPWCLSNIRCEKSGFQSQKGDTIYKAKLPQGCILYTLLQAHALGKFGVGRAHSYLQRLREHLLNHQEDIEKWCLAGPYDNQSWSFLFEEDEDLDVHSLEYAVMQVKKYYVSMIARHCSIMLALQPLTDNQTSNGASGMHDVIEDWQGRKYRLTIGIVDVDLEPYSNIEKIYKSWDEKLLQFWRLPQQPSHGQAERT